MVNHKRQNQEEPQSQSVPQQQINFNEYAGDAEDERLAREPANQYIDDIDRSVHKRSNPDTSNLEDHNK